jgi:POT family proton-dependent oligopeptide transporter
MANYVFPVVGALVADTLWGKYRTIVALSVVYCFGHLALAVDVSRLGLIVGLASIAIGAGGIKPCVSAHLGDQYPANRHHMLGRAYALFYLAINIGAFVSTLTIPLLLACFGPHVAFAVPGILMAIATFVFVAGRSRFVVVPPVRLGTYVAQLSEADSRNRILHTAGLFALLSIFWALFDQTASSWIIQAQRLDRTFTLPVFGAFELLPAQVQAFNPLLVLVFVPLFTWGIYPWVDRRFPFTPVRRIIVGIALAAFSFVIVGFVQQVVDLGSTVSIVWQALAYVVLTAAEVMVSVTALEYAYAAAPKASKSFVMSFYLLSVALGNLVTALVSTVMLLFFGDNGETFGPFYFWSFAALAGVTAGCIFLFFENSVEAPVKPDGGLADEIGPQ